MARHREWDLSCKVYIGNLGNNASEYEIENNFSKYGPIKNVWVARNPPGFAFVEYEDPRDAEDAVRALDGTWVTAVLESHYFTSAWCVIFVLIDEFFCANPGECVEPGLELKCHMDAREDLEGLHVAVVHLHHLKEIGDFDPG